MRLLLGSIYAIIPSHSSGLRGPGGLLLVVDLCHVQSSTFIFRVGERCNLLARQSVLRRLLLIMTSVVIVASLYREETKSCARVCVILTKLWSLYRAIQSEIVHDDDDDVVLLKCNRSSPRVVHFTIADEIVVGFFSFLRRPSRSYCYPRLVSAHDDHVLFFLTLDFYFVQFPIIL